MVKDCAAVLEFLPEAVGSSPPHPYSLDIHFLFSVIKRLFKGRGLSLWRRGQFTGYAEPQKSDTTVLSCGKGTAIDESTLEGTSEGQLQLV